MAWPEQRICGVIVECRGQVDAMCGARTIPHVIGCERSWECEGTRLLAVIVISSGVQLAEVWSVGSSGSLSAKGANGLLLCVTC
jgi:hypothetical protein